MENKADLYQPIVATRLGSPPLVIRALVTDNVSSIVGGVPQAAVKNEAYVLVSALPKELQERVRTAVAALVSGM